ncbi:hypothetical protein HI914_03086 [Erysiphe necator]|uniref:BTB domain-containing protein n=1 Tax=Uncinula necator TaxID=52586 RepID=A0A0B1P8N3_UNCNE|nr:hypothetical protein HI914_03086 [Erysiphe necator]KHJ35062.1 hypothetical protein EV44_g2021 [Erysiphe necator]
MVSIPDSTSSVVSHPSRQSYRPRSQVGCAHKVSRNEFPVFGDTGDVEILVNTGGKTNRYLLHRIILAQCSKFFLASTSNEWRKAPGYTVGCEEKTNEKEEKNYGKRWTYELDMGDGVHDVPVLVQRKLNRFSTSSEACPPPVRNKPGHTSHQSFVGSESVVSHQSLSSSSYLHREAAGLRQAYHNLFLTFYNYPPDLDSCCISRAYHQCKALLRLADLYDALPVVGPRIEHHLLRFQSALWRHIAKYPASYLYLGYFTASHSIFQEAFVHVLGRWPEIEYYVRERLPPCVTELMQDKYRDLKELVRGVEIGLWSLTLYTAEGKRVTPQNSYLDWLVMSFYREWLSEHCFTLSSLGSTQSVRNSYASKLGKASIEADSKIRTQSDCNVAVQKGELQEPSRIIHDQSSPRTSQILSFSKSQDNRVLHTILPSILLDIGRSSPSAPAYLGHEECKRFLKLSEVLYSRNNLRNFEQRLEELRALARQVVMPVMESQLNNGRHMEEYLVCIGIKSGEWPWEKKVL